MENFVLGAVERAGETLTRDGQPSLVLGAESVAGAVYVDTGTVITQGESALPRL